MIVTPDAPAPPVQPTPPNQDQQIDARDLVGLIDTARARMARGNDHRHLLLQCRAAIVHLVARVLKAEKELEQLRAAQTK